MSEERPFAKGDNIEAWLEGAWYPGYVKRALRDGGVVVVVPGPIDSEQYRGVQDVEWRPRREHLRPPHVHEYGEPEWNAEHRSFVRWCTVMAGCASFERRVADNEEPAR